MKKNREADDEFGKQKERVGNNLEVDTKIKQMHVSFRI